MAVNGIEIKHGQIWRNLLGDRVKVRESVALLAGGRVWRIDDGSGITYNVDSHGVANRHADALNLSRLIVDDQAPPTLPDTKDTNPKDAVGVRKAPMSTVSAAVLAEIGVAMLEGAAKYGKFNARVLGVRSSVYYDATMRHLLAWFEGEDIDPDSGLSHVTKAIASLVVLRDAMINKNVTDDRPPSSPAFYERLNTLAAAIIDKHESRSPTHYTIATREGDRK